MRGGISPRAATVAELLRDARLRHLRRRQVAPGADGGVLGGGPPHQLAAAEGLRPLLRVPPGRDRPVPPRADERQRPHRPAGLPRTTATTCPRTSSTRPTGWIGDLQSVPARPAVLPLPRLRRHPRPAPGAGRVPASGGAGRFDDGYDVARERWFARQHGAGHRPARHDARPAEPRRAGVGRPHGQPAGVRRRGCRRPSPPSSSTPTTRSADSPSTSSSRGLLDDTVLLVLSDNGACREGGPYGVMDEFSFFNGRARTSTTSSPSASTTSAGRTRTPTTRGAGRRPATRRCGGTSRTPTAVVCATRSSSTGPTASPRPAARSATQFCHAVDIAPTILEVPGRRPARRPQRRARSCRCTGASIASTFDDPSTRRRRGTSSTSSRWVTAASGTTAGR